MTYMKSACEAQTELHGLVEYLTKYRKIDTELLLEILGEIKQSLDDAVDGIFERADPRG